MTAAATPRRARPRRTSLIRSIVVPLDGSLPAEQALAVAGGIARAARARVRLVMVHQLPPPPADPGSARLYVSIEAAVRKSEREYLRRAAARLREWGITVSTLLCDGPVAGSLASRIRETGPDLVVMTTHGAGGLRRAFLGSVADHLVRSIDTPVLLVRPDTAVESEPGAPWEPRELLVPLDGSRLAEAALGPAAELARLFRVPLALAQVVTPIGVTTDPPLAASPGYDDQLTEIRLRESQDYLDSTAAGLREQGITARAAACVGWSVADTLLDLAGTSGALAIATHGRGGVKRALLGSVADKMVRGSDVPVLVVRP